MTISEAMELTGKNQRTVLWFVHQLAQAHPDQVMKEKID
jgi:hypothetical protein